jgi:hypothetical protein
MPLNSLQLIAACLAMVLLTFAVGLRMLFTRAHEMRSKRIHPQAASTSLKMAAQLQDVQAADNFRNLFEVPVLFYVLAAIAIATNYVPDWLVFCAWMFFVLRILHSLIHCTYNKVYHRFAAFLASFALLLGMWIAFFFSIVSRSAP